MQVFLPKTHPLYHLTHHFFIAAIGLFITYLVIGSITIWELFLFYFASYLPMIDEFFYAIASYTESDKSRKIINSFFVGDIFEMTLWIHQFRRTLYYLPLHNFISYVSLWFFWYTCYIFEFTPLVYFLAGIQIHLLFDLLNDYYEFGALDKWLWPVTLAIGSKKQAISDK